MTAGPSADAQTLSGRHPPATDARPNRAALRSASTSRTTGWRPAPRRSALEGAREGAHQGSRSGGAGVRTNEGARERRPSRRTNPRTFPRTRPRGAPNDAAGAPGPAECHTAPPTPWPSDAHSTRDLTRGGDSHRTARSRLVPGEGRRPRLDDRRAGRRPVERCRSGSVGISSNQRRNLKAAGSLSAGRPKRHSHKHSQGVRQ